MTDTTATAASPAEDGPGWVDATRAEVAAETPAAPAAPAVPLAYGPPTTTPVLPAVPAGWYHDPQDLPRVRYWNGHGWDDNAPTVGPAPGSQPVPPPAADYVDPAAPDPEPARDLPDGAVLIPIGDAGDLIAVKNPQHWHSRAAAALDGGDFERWAYTSLVEPDYEAVWCRLHKGAGPTLGECAEALDALWSALGASLGKSATSTVSSLLTVRR